MLGFADLDTHTLSRNFFTHLLIFVNFTRTVIKLRETRRRNYAFAELYCAEPSGYRKPSDDWLRLAMIAESPPCSYPLSDWMAIGYCPIRAALR